MALSGLLPVVIGKNWWDAFQYPTKLKDQSFGVQLLDTDIQDCYYSMGRILHPRKKSFLESSGCSEVTSTDKLFQIKLDTTDFKPEEVQVKMVGKFVVVHGKHEERRCDNEGTVAREFRRRYMLPDDCDPDAVVASWELKGTLVISVPKAAVVVKGDRLVPIQKHKKSENAPVQDSKEVKNGSMQKLMGKNKLRAVNGQ